MPAIPYIKKKINHSYLIWFQNSNLYLQLEEPAWFVLRKTVQRFKIKTIANKFSARYGISEEESLQFVKDIRVEIEKVNQTNHNPNITSHFPNELSTHQFVPYSTHNYKLGDKQIAFSYESQTFEHYLHPLISHFETTADSSAIPLFELFSFQDRIVFRFNSEVKGTWTKDETHLVKGLIFMHLINVMHEKTDADWLMTVHASAITDGTKTILFSAAPGNGKTTMAALLQTLGYQLISDDFVPIDRYSFCAYPFPIAMSVKQGSMDLLSSLFPALEQQALNYISPEKSVRYLPGNLNPDHARAIFPVHEFIFIEYNPSVDFRFEKLNPINAIKRLLDQAWVAPSRSNAAILFDQITNRSFYQLTYSNNQKALDAITKLFEHN